MVTTRPPKTIVKPTALGPVANTDTKLLIYGLFQKGRVLAQDGVDLFDARFVSGTDAPILNGRPIIDLEISVPLVEEVTLAIGGQNVLDTFSDRNDSLAGALGVPYSQFTPWGFSGGYYYARINYRWGQ